MNFVKNVVRILIPVLLVGIPAFCMEINFKLSGGYSFIEAKKVNQRLENWAEWRKREAEENKNWQYLGKNIRSLHSGIHLEGEILLSLSPRFGVSVGTGYIYGDLNENETEVKVQRLSGPLSQVNPITVSAYPLVLSGYYFIPLSHKLHFFIRAGGGLAWAKYVNREAKKLESAEKYNYFRLERASATGPILHAGFGFVYETDVGVRFFLEGLVRRAKIQGFSGENQLEETGTLYSFEEYISDLDFWLDKNEIRAEKPSGGNIRSVSEAEVDFSGFSVKIGFIIKF